MNEKIIKINQINDQKGREQQEKHEKEIKERIEAMANTDQSLNQAMESLRKEKDEKISDLQSQLESQRSSFEVQINEQCTLIQKLEATILSFSSDIFSLKEDLTKKNDVEAQLLETQQQEKEC